MRAVGVCLLIAVGCSASVQAGYPTLTAACKLASDCAVAGSEFQCVDGGCEILPCNCTLACPAGLGCVQVGGVDGECLAATANFSCDGG